MANITKRGNTYRIRVSCGLDINDKQIVKSTTYKPLPGMTEKQIQKELQKQALLFEEACKNGLVSNDPRLTFADFSEQYLAIKKNVLSPTVYEDYSQELNKLIYPQIGHLKLSAIRPVHIQNFVKYLAETPTTKTYRNGEKVTFDKYRSPATIRRIIAIVQSVLTQAVKLELISSNPSDSKKLTLPKATKPNIEIFTKQEAAQMLSCLENEPLQYRVLIQLAVILGARRGELVGLKFSDIDHITKKVVIERAAYKIKGKPTDIKPPNDFETRAVSIPDYCLKLLDELKEEKSKEAEKLGDQWVDGDWIFTQWNGSLMHPDTVTKWFSSFLSRYGLKHRRFNSLRHTSATLLLYGGVSLKQVQGRLGHGNIATTNKYLHIIAEADEEAANILSNMLTVKTKSHADPTDADKTNKAI
ncbi:site-specific integrase [Ruminococcus sp. NK3A76]|uniref:tyrosine-type recombinase/integrase n=1 Tax=Ruminococcus sp. NK3A76 TaxID=877411 RepID=UPI00048D38AB|nr:site-specific integrase [Ruminococcus sp. NK3A76]